MSTRSYIAKRSDDGKYALIYCHFDGYPEGVGYMLYNFYNTDDKVSDLIIHGDCSYIRPDIESCCFYHRDYHVEFDDVKPKVLGSFKELSNYFVRACDDFIYLFQDGEWFCHAKNYLDEKFYRLEVEKCHYKIEMRKLSDYFE